MLHELIETLNSALIEAYFSTDSIIRLHFSEKGMVLD